MAGEMLKSPMNGVVPYITVSDAKEAIGYYASAFGAKEIDRRAAEDGRLMHAHVEINGGAFMFSDPFPEWGVAFEPVRNVVLHLIVADAAHGGRAPWMRALMSSCRSTRRSGATSTGSSGTDTALPGPSWRRPMARPEISRSAARGRFGTRRGRVPNFFATPLKRKIRLTSSQARDAPKRGRALRSGPAGPAWRSFFPMFVPRGEHHGVPSVA